MSNDTQTLSLTDFLLARIAEDEAAAPFVFAEQFTPARIRAECHAKRRIIATRYPHLLAGKDDDLRVVGYKWAREAALRALALPYADHPDYREEWKP